MTDARSFYVEVELLDHQILDAEGKMAGKVDDAELTIAEDGSATLTAVLSGPGVLATRLGHDRYGPWRERLERTLEPNGEAMTKIPIHLVRSITTAVIVSIGRERLASTGTERWVREHVISKIPGARHG